MSIERQKITTIKLSASTKSRLEHLRVYPRESYEDILKNILEILNLCLANPEQAKQRLIQIDQERKRNLSARKN